MAILTTRTTVHRRRAVVFPVFTLARLQSSRLWRLLLLTGIGMLAAVILACTIPLYSWLALTAGLRDIFATPGAASVTVQSSATQISTSLLNQSIDQTNSFVLQDLGNYVDRSAQFMVNTDAYAFQAADNDTKSSGGQNTLTLLGQDISRVKAHLHIVQGQLPNSKSTVPEVLLSKSTADYLKATVGSQLTVVMPYTAITRQQLESQSLLLPIRVSGIVNDVSSNDDIWHGITLAPTTTKKNTILTALIPSTVLLTTLDKMNAHDTAIQGIQKRFAFTNTIYFSWFYHVKIGNLDANRVEELATDMEAFTTDVPAFAVAQPMITNTTVMTPVDTLKQYSDHIAIAQLPTAVLTILVVALLTFFVSLMADLLVFRQESEIAIIRSRGASRGQIFGALLVQCVVLSLGALAIGTLLVLPVTTALVHATLPASEQNVLNLINDDPRQALWQVRWLILGAGAIVFVTMGLSTYRATRNDVLMLRRESARATRVPFWQRLYLDVVAMVVAAVAYGISLYLINAGLLDAKLRVLLQGPLLLVTSLLLLVAGSLLFLRIFPLLLQLGIRLAGRGNGGVATLGLGLMARAPQQSLRMILLLTFALSFVVFSLVFSASQTQHMYDVSSYQTGADFSGTITGTVNQASLPVKKVEQNYHKIQGLISSVAGYSSYSYISEQDASGQNNTIKTLAIDPENFLSATSWSNQYATSTELKDQLKSLQKGRANTLRALLKAGEGKAVPLPVLVDSKVWRILHLKKGGSFTLYVGQLSFPCIVLGQVPPIPSVNDNTETGTGEGGVLIDYESFEATYNNVNANDIRNGQVMLMTPNYAWLRTNDDAKALASARKLLHQDTLRLDPLIDRRALLAGMHQDPLYLNFVGVLAVGAIAPILLALVGNLLTSWWNARNRMNSFVILRALGGNLSQLTNILLCELSVIYLTALALGLLFGFVLATLTLPALVFTNISDQNHLITEGNNTSVFSIQNVPPIHIVTPLLLIVVVGAMIVLCTLVLMLMVRTVMRPSISQSLRLNED